MTDPAYPYDYATGEVPWLLYPMWEHYLVSGDTSFLQNTLYPMLLEEGNFYVDFCTGAQGDNDSQGHYVFTGVSPENQPSNSANSLLNNSTFDVSGCRFALNALILASNILGQNTASIPTWQNLLSHLPPYMIGGTAFQGSTGNGNTIGALQEWNWPGLSDTFAHRHSSQLLPIWPYGEITPENNPVLYPAVQATELAKNNGENSTGGGGGTDRLQLREHRPRLAAQRPRLRPPEERHRGQPQAPPYDHGQVVLQQPDDGALQRIRRDPYCTDMSTTIPDVMLGDARRDRATPPTPSASPGTPTPPTPVTGGVVELMQAVPTTVPQGTLTGLLTLTQVTVKSLTWNQTAKTISCTLLNTCGSNQTIVLIVRKGISTIATTGSPVSTLASLPTISRLVPLAAGVPTTLTITTN